ncbi:hypothetical protein cyc_08807 [Cyclospora cayetanensis]|uniref:Metallo-beta-lactamase domain-containing protein n=1 Tax=Cyclospora cayetanensis TaxID=88456 RepID=A0A1D3D7A2_9EIME|nr:hypothetical protein cyc_08807 [Cyclospora cayetanensis]
MIEVLGSLDSPEFAYFLHLCCLCFKYLRTHAYPICLLLECMATSSLKDITKNLVTVQGKQPETQQSPQGSPPAVVTTGEDAAPAATVSSSACLGVRLENAAASGEITSATTTTPAASAAAGSVLHHQQQASRGTPAPLAEMSASPSRPFKDDSSGAAACDAATAPTNRPAPTAASPPRPVSSSSSSSTSGRRVCIAIERVKERFRLDLSDEEAEEALVQIIISSAGALIPAVVDRLHEWAIYWNDTEGELQASHVTSSVLSKQAGKASVRAAHWPAVMLKRLPLQRARRKGVPPPIPQAAASVGPEPAHTAHGSCFDEGRPRANEPSVYAGAPHENSGDFVASAGFSRPLPEPQVDAFSVESDGVAWRQFAAREEDAIKRVLLLLQLEQQQRRRAAAAPGGAVAGLSWKALDSLLKARAAAARRRADSREFSEERRQRISTVSAEFSSEDAEAASSGRELREVLLEEGWSVVENVKQQTIRLPRALRSLLLQQGGFGLKELLQSAIEKSGNSPFFPALSPVFSSLAEEARAGVTPRHLSMSEAYSRAYKQLADAVHPHKLTRAVKVDGHYLYPWSVFTKQEREQLWLMADQLKWLPKWIKHHRVARKPPPRVLKTHLPVLKPKFTDIYGGPGAPSLGAEPGVRYTWLGHASGLVTIDGLNVLIDPVLGEDIVGAMSDLAKRFLNFVNSKLCGSLGERLRPAPARISELPSDLHLVILSHNHQDHIMERDIKHLCRTHKERFKHLMWYVPEGVAWFLVKHGCSPQRVCEFTWGESRTLSCMPRNGQYACSDGGGRQGDAFNAEQEEDAAHASLGARSSSG